MPELPEVETVRMGLQPVLEGHSFTRVETRRGDLRVPFPKDFAKRLTGRKVARLWRRAKYLLGELDGGETLVVHLGMSGNMSVYAEGQERKLGNYFYDAGARDSRPRQARSCGDGNGRARPHRLHRSPPLRIDDADRRQTGWNRITCSRVWASSLCPMNSMRLI